MKKNEGNDWVDVGKELFDIQYLGKSLIPFSKAAQIRFDSHPKVVSFINDFDYEIYINSQGTEFYLNPNETVRISVGLNEIVLIRYQERKFSYRLNQSILNEDIIRVSTFCEIQNSSRSFPIIPILFIFLVILLISLTIN